MDNHVRSQFQLILITVSAILLISSCASTREQGYDCASYRYGDLLYEEIEYLPEHFWTEKLVEPGYCAPDPRLEGWAAALKLDVDAYTGQVPEQERVIVTNSELGGARYVVLGKIRWPVFEGVDGYSCTEDALAGRALQIYDNADAVIVSRSETAPANTTANAFRRMFRNIGVASSIHVGSGVYLSSYSSGSPDYWMTTACGGIAVKFLDKIETDILK